METGKTICGLDEAGRGPLAGPLVAAAVVFPTDFHIAEVLPTLRFGDSKMLSSRQREKAFTYIHEFALDIKVEIVSVEDINRQNIGWANRAAFERLIMSVEADSYIADGNLKLSNLGKKAKLVRSLVDADKTEQCVSAASIVAKVTRDRIMQQLHLEFPIYGWERNKGYGTLEHRDALHAYGISPHHRVRFVQTALSKKRPQLPGMESSASEQDNPS